MIVVATRTIEFVMHESRHHGLEFLLRHLRVTDTTRALGQSRRTMSASE
jgi:hypothetical protein